MRGCIVHPPLMNEKRAVTIRNVVYESVTAAAKALGVHRTTVIKAARRGSLDYVGLRQAGPKPFKVRSRGRIYENVKECARDNNVSISTVYSAITAGREDWIGVRKQKLLAE